MRRGHAGRVVGPGFWQAEGAVDEGVALTRDIGCQHPDLAVGDLARRAGVLAGHAARGLALLQEPRLVHDQNGIGLGQRLDHIAAHHIAQRVRIPPSPPEQGLLTPGTRVAGRFRPHPAGLAPLRTEQGIEEQTGGGRHALLLEQGSDAPLHVPQR